MSEMDEQRAKELLVPCTKCGANVGVGCILGKSLGIIDGAFHLRRQIAAARLAPTKPAHVWGGDGPEPICSCGNQITKCTRLHDDHYPPKAAPKVEPEPQQEEMPGLGCQSRKSFNNGASGAQPREDCDEQSGIAGRD